MVFTLFCEEILTIDFKSMAWISWTWSIVFLDPNPLKEYCAQAYFSIITGPKEHALTILLSDFLFAMLFCFFFSFRGCLWTLCCIWTFKTHLHLNILKLGYIYMEESFISRVDLKKIWSISVPITELQTCNW